MVKFFKKLYELYRKHQDKVGFALLTIYAAFVFMFDADESNIILVYAAYALVCVAFLFLHDIAGASNFNGDSSVTNAADKCFTLSIQS